MTTTRSPIALILTSLALSGCAGSQTRPGGQPPQAGASAAIAPIVMDGDTGEWTGQGPVRVTADSEHIFVRFDPANPGAAIQAAPFTTRILIDADNNPDTGRPVGTLGVEAMAALSPAFGGGTGSGSEVIFYDQTGKPTTTSHTALNFFFLPSYASSSYEARIDRAPLNTLIDTGRVAVRVDETDAHGAVLWSAKAESAVPRFSPPTNTVAMPAKPAAGLRVLSQNVLYASPLKNPGAFDRMITAIDPDVILFQEWFNTPQNDIQSWFDTNLGPGWTVIAPDPEEGVALATRMPILLTIADLLDVPAGRQNARFVGALIDTPIGPFFGASIHLKCCGGSDSDEDRRRISEATAINATVSGVLGANPGAAVMVAGDYNLVGTRAPLDTVRAGLAADGSDLTPAETLTLGDPAAVTWVDESSRFSPGRLDWAVVDETVTTIAHAFTLDTRRLSPASLAQTGLHAEDSTASDHLPVVVDLVPAK